MVEYGLIGYPLEHSFSARYFSEKFRKLNIDARYDLYPLKKLGEFPDLMSSHPDLAGLNVTLPYKEKIIGYLDEMSADAREIGAVNVISIRREPIPERKVRLKGYNTDWIGFSRSLKPLLRKDLTDALVLGTGGASKGVAYALRELGIGITFVSRQNKEHRDNLLTYAELTKEIIERHLLIVNTTPLGTYPAIDTYPELPYQFLTPDHLSYDLVYNPEVTRFMSLSRRYGARVKNGLEMLHIQAEEAWNIFKPDDTDLTAIDKK